MPSGDAAILKSVTTRLQASRLARWRPALSATPSSLLPLLDQLRGDSAVARKVLIAACTLAVCIIGAVALLRARTPADSPSIHAAAFAPLSSRQPPASALRPERARPFAADFKVLLVRSMFATGGVAGSGQAPPSQQDIPPSALALKGISQEDASFTAFVEDTTAGRMVQVHVGDTLGSGQVRDLSLHELVYALDGKVVHVEVGQGLDGNPWTAAPQPDPASKSGHKHKKVSATGDVRASIDQNR